KFFMKYIRQTVNRIGILVLFFLSNCMTVVSFTQDRFFFYDSREKKCTDGTPYALIYGGIRADADFILKSANKEHHPHSMAPDWLVLTLSLIDSPFAAALDTVFLPVTAPRAYLRFRDLEKMNEKLEKLTPAELKKKEEEIIACETL
ncbi:MAG TPA: hypothetical protein PKV80_28555, partial [Leptospiraceae bacterium]|nr:hypothetical protein [Leptospiraceae bacterium]